MFAGKNEEIKVLELRGTCESSLTQSGLIDALKEFDEYGKLTKGEKTIFHLAIAPSDFDRMDSGKWQYAVSKAEEALGFQGQPRAVVMHTYGGKDHLHVAWSRVDLETHKLKSDSFTNLKLCNAARDIELDLGLQKLPDIHRGHDKARRLTEELTKTEKKAQERKPRQREREVQKFAEDAGETTKQKLHRTIATAWHRSDTGEEFRRYLAQSGYRLARGDRGAVIMDATGNVFSSARYIEDAKAKDINEKCAKILNELPTVDQARDHGKEQMLSPRKAARLVRTRLKLEISNDMKRTPITSIEYDEF
ncbi:relaxase/mobilization nuclease domain-containing protein [Microcoleus sp. B7-D4]|uniref:relaxase/mobilization nuclease domain-containing protein n=1 Tax=Microcoleus sp. B7-D4 TaxID=2818696 RepID=UPI002FD1B942